MKIGDCVVTPKGTGFVTFGIKDRVEVMLDGHDFPEWFYYRQIWSIDDDIR